MEIADSDVDFSDPHWGSDQLVKISIFAAMQKDELAKLYKLGRVIRIAAHANIVIEGEASRGLFLLLHGTVSVYKSSLETDGLIRLAFLEVGSCFGEMSLFENAPRSATITAESECFLFELESKVFDAFLESEGNECKARFYKRCAEDLAERFRRQNSDYVVSQRLLWKYALKREDKQTTEDP